MKDRFVLHALLWCVLNSFGVSGPALMCPALIQCVRRFRYIRRFFDAPVRLSLFSHDLEDDVSLPVSGVTFHQCEVLPGADGDPSVHKGDRDKGGHDQGMDV